MIKIMSCKHVIAEQKISDTPILQNEWTASRGAAAATVNPVAARNGNFNCMLRICIN
jgi:hypothetical protein